MTQSYGHLKMASYALAAVSQFHTGSGAVSRPKLRIRSQDVQVKEVVFQSLSLMDFRGRSFQLTSSEVLQSAPVSPEYTLGMSTDGYMGRQFDLFMDQVGVLLAQYEGTYVAFEDGNILASGSDFWQVVDQVNEQRGDVRPMFVERVQREYPPIEM